MVTALVAGLMLAIGACGEESSSGTVTLNFWAYNEPGGTFRAAADRCTAESNGRYRIEFNALGNDPNTQRQALVRRLAAGDSSIDIMSMDVIWTAEFAEAGWIKPFPDDVAAQIKDGTLKGPLDTATYDGKLYGAPANSNTQLLWYRKDLVQTPPKTWSEMIDMAVKMPKAGRIEIQGDAYEGYTVWFNSLIQSAGGQILASPTKVAMPEGPTKAALGVIQKLANVQGGGPVAAGPARGPEPARVRDRRRGVPGQLPVHLSERPGQQGADLQGHRVGAVSGGRRRQALARADRRLQLGRRRQHEAPGGGVRRRGVHAQRAQPA